MLERSQPWPLIPQSDRKNEKTHVGSDGDQREENDNIPTRPELSVVLTIASLLGKELLVALLASEEADGKHTSTVCCKKGPDAVEFGREDLEHHQGKGKLRQCSADVSTLERPLRGANLDEFLVRQNDGSCTMATVVV